MGCFTDDLGEYDEELRPLLAPANVIVDQLRARLVPEKKWNQENFLSGLAHIVTQSFVRRSLAFVHAGVTEYRQERSLVTSVCARSILENIAACCDFVNQALAHVVANDRDALLEILHSRTFATRDKVLLADHGRGVEAVNVLTQIDRLDKTYPGFRSSYDRLSEFTHPNAMGTTVQYASLKRGGVTYHDGGTSPHWGINQLALSTLELARMHSAIDALEKGLEEWERGPQ